MWWRSDFLQRMIELTLEDLAVGVVGGALVVVCGAVWVSRWSNANAARRGVKFRMECRLCRHVWEDRSGERDLDCPQCGATNRRGRGHRAC